MSQDQNAEQSHNIKIGFNSFHRVEKFKYLTSSWLSKNLKIKIYRTIILSVVLYRCETWAVCVCEQGAEKNI